MTQFFGPSVFHIIGGLRISLFTMRGDMYNSVSNYHPATDFHGFQNCPQINMLDQRKQIKHKTVIKSRRVRRTRREKIPELQQLESCPKGDSRNSPSPGTLRTGYNYCLHKWMQSLARRSLNKACTVHTRTQTYKYGKPSALTVERRN